MTKLSVLFIISVHLYAVFLLPNSVVIRNGSVTAEIPDGISVATIAAVVKAVSQY